MINFLHKLKRIAPKIRRARTAIHNLGLIAYTRFRFARHNPRTRAHDAVFTLNTPYALYPLFCRAHTSDLNVFDQIFADREYAPLDDLPRNTAGLIIDCGANVGYSAAYFLTRFLNATLVAIEPAPDNFATLARNIAPYAPRARALHAALWSHPTTLAIATPAARDGHEWSRQVRPGNAEPHLGSSDVPAYDIPSILRETNHTRIFLLKIDIEGAESEIFSGDTSWLAAVDNLVIELHNKPPFPDAHPIVEHVMSRHPFKRSTSGELTIWRRTSSA